jgi:hypothetical protein
MQQRQYLGEALYFKIAGRNFEVELELDAVLTGK